jgi:hypothetical protein
MKEMACRKPRDYLMRLKLASSLAMVILMALTSIGAVSATPAAAAVPTVVTIEWHDENADQINVPPILIPPGRCMRPSWQTRGRSLPGKWAGTDPRS